MRNIRAFIAGLRHGFSENAYEFNMREVTPTPTTNSVWYKRGYKFGTIIRGDDEFGMPA